MHRRPHIQGGGTEAVNGLSPPADLNQSIGQRVVPDAEIAEAQAQGFRDAGRHDLAAQAEAQMLGDAAKGAANGVVRGTAVALTQAVLGANPLTAGIGLVAPDAVMLLTQKDRLSKADYNRKSLEVVGKGALATALVCAGPVGWLGLAPLGRLPGFGLPPPGSWPLTYG